MSSIFLSLLISNVVSVVLEYEFDFADSYWGFNYACVTTDFKTTKDDRTVTEIRGQHVDDEDNFSVKMLLVEAGSCPYLPLNISSHFKNLEIYYIMDSGVKFLMDGDLDELTKLRIFDVSHNPIRRAGKSFFKGQNSIEIISFYECQLRNIHPEFLNPLVKLREAYFDKNVCVDFRASQKSLVSALKSEIEKNCKNDDFDGIAENVTEEESSTNRSTSEAMSSQAYPSIIKHFTEFIILFLVGMLIFCSVIIGVLMRRVRDDRRRNSRQSIKLRESF